tara:strand:+ start:3585 stop:3875 length:291 start_codon:yes stop_codon:yes gene_type:complete
MEVIDMPRRNRYKIKRASRWTDDKGRTYGSVKIEDLKQDRKNPDFQKKYRTKEMTLSKYSVSKKYLGNFKRPRTTIAGFFGAKSKLARKILNIRSD